MVNHPVLEELIRTDQLTTEQAEAISKEHRNTLQPINTLTTEQGYLPEQSYLNAVMHLLGAKPIDITKQPIRDEVVAVLPSSIARRYQTVPVALKNNRLTLAVADVPSPDAMDELAFMTPYPIDYVVAPMADLLTTLLQLYGTAGDTVNELLSAAEKAVGQIDLFDPQTILLDDLEDAANSTPVIHFVNLVLYQAIKDRASDIHFEPFEHAFKIRYRVDGALSEMVPPPKRLALPIISRIKVIAGLNISETRLPQDGRIQLTVANRSVDFRVSTLPTQFGESVVLRVLDRSNVQLNIDNIGFPDDIHDEFIKDIEKPNGILIVTGPTGSGKTTTLYAALQQINTLGTKILTAEDPVEYDVDGIIQMPIRENIGLTFASALRSFLRQDPDVIMVGEIRDLETAQIAIQTSLTGHLVFSTLHTNDAAGAITRLIDMGVEPFLMASTLNAILGQRLLRTICTECRAPYQPNRRILDQLDLAPHQMDDQPFYTGNGCAQCNESGYRGRRAIFEYMPITDPLRQLIIQKRPALTIRNKAMELGMRTLREDAIRCILDGYTTVEEVIQYT